MIIDGDNALHRMMHVPAYAAMETDGTAIGAALGFLLSMRKVIDMFKPKHATVVWDGEDSFRLKSYPAYKSNRQPKTETERVEKALRRVKFTAQKFILNRIIPLLGCRVAEMRTFEGDDIIAGLAAVIMKRNEALTIVTDDIDLCQLINPKCQVYRPVAQSLVTGKELLETAGVSRACDVPWSKAIQGDKSDGISGVRGWGEVHTKAFIQAARATLGAAGGNDIENGKPQQLTAEMLKQLAALGSSANHKNLHDRFQIVTDNLKLVDLAQSPIHERVTELEEIMDAPVHHDEDSAHRLMLHAGMIGGEGSRIDGFFGWVTPFRVLR